MDFPADQRLLYHGRVVASAGIIGAMERDYRALPPPRRRLGRRGASDAFDARTPNGLFKKFSGSKGVGRKIPARFGRRRDRGYRGDAPKSAEGACVDKHQSGWDLPTCSAMQHGRMLKFKGAVRSFNL